MDVYYLLGVIVIFLLGSAVGSFLNVVIDRLSRGESIIAGRSYCEKCKKKLAPFELIPIFSYLFLKGRCKKCKTKIPTRLLFIEALTGFMFVFLFILFLLNIFTLIKVIFLAVILSIFICIMFSDLEYGIIPDELIIGFTAISLLNLFIFEQMSLVNSFLSGISLFIFFVSLFFITKRRGMGFGDVKLSFGLGLFLGFPKIVVAMYLAFLTGAAVSLILIAWGKKKLKKDTIPFGPFLIFATVVSYFFGEPLIAYFLSFLQR